LTSYLILRQNWKIYFPVETFLELQIVATLFKIQSFIQTTNDD